MNNKTLEINTVHQGDCLELMKLIPDKSIDCIMADLPYALKKRGYTHCEWDNPIDLELLWKEYERIIKDNAAIILTASQPFTSALVMSNLKLFKAEWIWEKMQATNFGSMQFQPGKIHESVLIFSRGTTKYYPQMREGFKPYPPTEKPIQRKKDIEIFGGSIRKTKINYGQPEGKRYPVSIVKFNREAGFHPTQKPIALGKLMLSSYCKPGELMLDNTAGSCSFLCSAKELGINFIGIEKEQKYVDIGNERLNKIIPLSL